MGRGDVNKKIVRRWQGGEVKRILRDKRADEDIKQLKKISGRKKIINDLTKHTVKHGIFMQIISLWLTEKRLHSG